MRRKALACAVTTLGLVTFFGAPATAGDCTLAPIKGNTTCPPLPEECDHCPANEGNDAQYEITVPCSGHWTITVQADWDWILSVGTTACSSNVGSTDYGQELTVNLSTGTTYHITVDGYNLGDEGQFLLTFALTDIPQYRLIDLGTLPYAWNVDTKGTFGINSDGDVAYGAKNAVGNLVPKVWDGSTITPLDCPSSTGIARDINDAGQIVGQVGGTEIREGNAVLWEPNQSGWGDATVINPFGDTNCPWARAHAINNDATDPVIALESDFTAFCADECMEPDPEEVDASRGFLTTVSSVGSNLEDHLDPGSGDLECYPSTYCRDVNTGSGSGVVVAGFANLEAVDCSQSNVCAQGDSRRAAAWPNMTAAVALDRFEAGGGHAPILSEALGVNDSGNTVGWGHTSGSGGGSPHAAFWETPTADVVDLGDTMPAGQGDDNSRAYAISNEDEDHVVYVAGTNETSGSALLWTRDENEDWSVVDLNDQNLTSVALLDAHDVNDDGELVATGRIGAQDYHVYALKHIETSSCPRDVDESGDVGFSDVLEILGAWGACGVGSPSCPADVNFDSRVDFGDIILVLANWGPCGESPEPDSIPDVLDEMGLTFSDWIDFLYTLSTGPEVDQTNYLCWMEHYWTVHFLHVCLCNPNCPGDDPWGGHP